jgi:hypothetical protein
MDEEKKVFARFAFTTFLSLFFNGDDIDEIIYQTCDFATIVTILLGFKSAASLEARRFVEPRSSTVNIPHE